MSFRTPQYWLAELDEHDNPILIDGSHSSPEGCNQAAFLIQSIGLGKSQRRFAVAKVELSECVPSGENVNQSAVDVCRAMVSGAKMVR